MCYQKAAREGCGEAVLMLGLVRVTSGPLRLWRNDFLGGQYEAFMQQESISVDSTVVADGKWHLVAMVVNQTTLSFFTDAELQKESFTWSMPCGKVQVVGARLRGLRRRRPSRHAVRGGVIIELVFLVITINFRSVTNPGLSRAI